jgi:LytR cell envelope-related transcriptional attenuator
VSDPNGVRPSRAQRSHEVQRRWRIQAVVAGAVVLVLLVWLVTRSNGEDTSGAAPTSSATPSATVSDGRAQLLAFSVTGAPNALLASVGTGGGLSSAAVIVPPNLTLIMPGAGEMSAEQLQDLPGDPMRIGVSNVDGTWNGTYAVMDLGSFAAVVDRNGGLNVDLQDVYTSGGTVLGPGQAHLIGDQVTSLLKAQADDVAARWADVLSAFLATQPNVQQGDFSDTDDAQAAAEILGAGAADVQIMPTQVVGGTALITAQPDLDQLMTQLFGTPTPFRAEVRNGNGQPGVGEAVGAQLIPAGFRIVLSENADTFDYKSTQIIAAGTENDQVAEQAKEAIGVGKVIVSRVPSGLADVTVIVGADYHP